MVSTFAQRSALLLALSLPVGIVSAATFYVSPTGSDSNSGAATAPFRTIQKGLNSANAGDTVFVRAGRYHEAVTFPRSGEAGKPVTLAGYPGERPVIDGEYSLPVGGTLVTDTRTGTTAMAGGVALILTQYGQSHLVIRNLEVTRSWGNGVLNRATDTVFEDLRVIDSRRVGLHIGSRQRVTVSNSVIAGSQNWAPYDRTQDELNWGGGLVAQGDLTSAAQGSVFRGNTVYHTWGEGIIVMGVDRFTLEDNVAYDNWACEIYAEHSSNIVIQRNLAYHSGLPPYLRGGRPPHGILLADEVEMDQYFPDTQYTHDIQVLNNLALGNRVNFIWSGNVNNIQYAMWEPGDPGGLANSLIANNTFVNAVRSGVEIWGGVHTNARIENNIVLQDAGTVAEAFSDPNLHFYANLWSRTPPSNAASPADVVGNPTLARTGIIGPGELLPDYFRLLSNSPAINRGGVLSEVVDDYFGNSRGSTPDIGAHEFNPSAPPPTPPTPTPTPSSEPSTSLSPDSGDIPTTTNSSETTNLAELAATEVDSNWGCRVQGSGGGTWIWILSLLGMFYGSRRGGARASPTHRKYAKKS